MRARAVRLATFAALAAVALVLSACGGEDDGNADTGQLDSVEAPQLGACRALTPEDVALPSNATKIVDCAKEHTAETFAVGDLPAELEDAEYDVAGAGGVRLPDLLRAVPGVPRRRREHGDAHHRELGVVPAVGEGVGQGRAVVPLRRHRRRRGEQGVRRAPAHGGRAAGAAAHRTTSGWSASTGPRCRSRRRSPAAEKHNWRAVTTIKVGDPEDPYPGDRVVEVTTRDYCSRSVGAWLGYPPEYDFGYTWFHEGEWKAGNRRSVCWAATTA